MRITLYYDDHYTNIKDDKKFPVPTVGCWLFMLEIKLCWLLNKSNPSFSYLLQILNTQIMYIIGETIVLLRKKKKLSVIYNY